MEIESTNLETRNSKQAPSSKSSNLKRYDLEDRTLAFAKEVRLFLGAIPKTYLNMEDGKQLLRSSGSVGANYREANDSLSKKDFLMRIKISRKEAKETVYWLELIVIPDLYDQHRRKLLIEATELMKIMGAIVRKTE
jgi:four helix bundle protein